MQQIFLFILLMQAFAAVAQTDTARTTDADGTVMLRVVQRGKPLLEGRLRGDQKIGAWTAYWNNGIPQSITSYESGKKEGTAIYFERDGLLYRSEMYHLDQLSGPMRTYSRHMLYAEETNYVGGMQDGLQTTWYPNGKVQQQVNYKRGQREGASVFYREDGSKSAEYFYRSGIPEGQVTLYHENGKPSETGAYIAGKPSGPWREYYLSGKLKAEGNYADGEKEGSWKEYPEGEGAAKLVKYRKGTLISK